MALKVNIPHSIAVANNFGHLRIHVPFNKCLMKIIILYLDQYPPPKHIYERYCDMFSAHGDAAAIRSSCALLYIVLDTLGDSGFQMFAEHIHLDIATNRLIEDCWAVDHLRIDVSAIGTNTV